MVNALLRVEDMNIIVVDWENGAAPPYPSAVVNSRLVGKFKTKYFASRCF